MDTKRLGSSICGALVGGAFGMAASIISSWVLMQSAGLPISLRAPFISAIPGFFAGALGGCLIGLVVKEVSPRMARTLQIVAGVSAVGIILVAGHYVAAGPDPQSAAADFPLNLEQAAAPVVSTVPQDVPPPEPPAPPPAVTEPAPSPSGYPYGMDADHWRALYGGEPPQVCTPSTPCIQIKRPD